MASELKKNNDNGHRDRRRYDFVTETICDRIYRENNRRFESLEKTNLVLINELKEIKTSINSFIYKYFADEAKNKAMIIIGKLSIVIIPILISLIAMSSLYIITKTPNVNKNLRREEMSTYLKILQENVIKNHNVKINEAEVTDEQKAKYKLSAKKMVDNIEAKRKEGKYSPEERAKLEKKFYDNTVKMVQKGGDI